MEKCPAFWKSKTKGVGNNSEKLDAIVKHWVLSWFIEEEDLRTVIDQEHAEVSRIRSNIYSYNQLFLIDGCPLIGRSAVRRGRRGRRPLTRLLLFCIMK